MKIIKLGSKYSVRLSVLLLCFAIAVSAIISGSIAFYRLSNDAVAEPPLATYEFIVGGVESSDSFTLDLTELNRPNTSKEITFTVSNGNSKIWQSYDIGISSTGNLPLAFSLKKQGEEDELLDGNNKIKSEINIGPEAATHTYVLTVTWDANDNDLALRDEIDLVTVNVSSTQKEPQINGN